MKKIWIFAGLALLLAACGTTAPKPTASVSTPEASAPAATCVSEQQFVTGATTSTPPGLTVSVLKVLRGDQAQAVINAYNQLPPASSWAADAVVIIHATGAGGEEHPKWLIGLFKDGCKQDAALAPKSVIELAIGDPA